MVGGDEDHRVVVEACGSHLVQQTPEEGVCVLRLQHVPLEGLVDQPLAARPVLAPEPGVAAAVDRVGAAVRQVARRPVRHRRVHEDQRRPRRRAVERGLRAREAERRVVGAQALDHLAQQLVARAARLDAGEPPLGLAAEAEPAAVDRRQPFAQVVGQQQVLGHDRQVVGERAEPRAHRRPGLRAQAGGAHVRDRLDDGELVAVAEQREEAARVVRRGRQVARLGQLAGELRRDRLRRAVGHSRRIAEPRRARREAGQVGEALGVDRAVARQRRHRQLVEQDEDDRRRGARGAAGRGRHLARRQQVRDRGDHEEEEEEDERRGGEEGEEGAHDGRSRVRHRERRAQRQGDPDGGDRARQQRRRAAAAPAPTPARRRARAEAPDPARAGSARPPTRGRRRPAAARARSRSRRRRCRTSCCRARRRTRRCRRAGRTAAGRRPAPTARRGAERWWSDARAALSRVLSRHEGHRPRGGERRPGGRRRAARRARADGDRHRRRAAVRARRPLRRPHRRGQRHDQARHARGRRRGRRPADRLQPARGRQPRERHARPQALARACDRAHQQPRVPGGVAGAGDRRRLHGLLRARDGERDLRPDRHPRRPADRRVRRRQGPDRRVRRARGMPARAR